MSETVTSPSRAERVRSGRGDDGQALLTTLVLTLVLAIVAVALIGYVTTVLRSSRVTSDLVDGGAAGTAAIYFSMEELSTGGASCDTTIVVPAAAMPDREAMNVICSTVSAGSPATISLDAIADRGDRQAVSAVVEIVTSGPSAQAGRIVSWSVAR